MKIKPFFILALGLTTVLSTQVSAANKQKSEATVFNEYCSKELVKGRDAIKRLESIKSPFTVENILEPLNDFEMQLSDASSQANLYLAVHPEENVRKAAGECVIKISNLATDYGLSRPVFDALVALDVSKESADIQRYVKVTLERFRRSGVDKSESGRSRIKALRDEIANIGQEFGTNIRQDVRSIELTSVDQLAGMPQDYIDAHQPDDKGIITLTTAYPDYLPFRQYAENDDIRKKYFLEFTNRGYPQNKDVLTRLAEKRFELARLLGYKNYAEYIMADKMIGSPENARNFIEKIGSYARAPMNQDKSTFLNRLKKDQADATSVYRWQKGYLQDQIMKEDFRLDSQEVRQYFAYNNVRDGILNLVSGLFDVSIKKWDTPVWHESVEAYEIYDNGELVGRFYLDMFPRDGKYQHARISPIKVGVKGRQIPVATLITNFPAGENLMGHNQVETYLHEFGHLLHYMFSGNQRWASLGGLSTEWDFVEAPSQMLEEWIWDKDTLQTFAINKDGQPIPDELVERMNKARNFARGYDTMHQLYYGSLSLNLYDRNPKGLDLDQLSDEMQVRYSPYPVVNESHFYASFGHLDGYSAIYYTYQWSLAIASDMFTRFKKEGINNKAVARDYRFKVLAPGGSKPAADLVQDFLGRPYSFSAYADVLSNKEI